MTMQSLSVRNFLIMPNDKSPVTKAIHGLLKKWWWFANDVKEKKNPEYLVNIPSPLSEK